MWRLRCFVGESSKSNFHILHAEPQMPNPGINDTQIPVSTVTINDVPKLDPDTSINGNQNVVSMIPRYQYPSINDTQNPVSKYQ